MMRLNVCEWLFAKVRNIRRARSGGQCHSVMMKVYDNGRLVLCREVYTYEINSGHVSEVYIVGRTNAFISDLYGRMLKSMKLASRNAKKGTR